MIGSQLSDEETIISVEGQDVTVAQYIDSTYGFSEDRVWYSALILVGFCIAFWFVVAGKSQPSLHHFVPLQPHWTGKPALRERPPCHWFLLFVPLMSHSAPMPREGQITSTSMKAGLGLP